MISLEKRMILIPVQKLPNNVGDLSEIIVAICFEWLPKAENTHLLCKGKYHCRADLQFDQLGFGQTSKSVYSFNSSK